MFPQAETADYRGVVCPPLLLLLFCRVVILFFFFQAEDGIRDRNVTGVQTCALPISKGIAHLWRRDQAVGSALETSRSRKLSNALRTCTNARRTCQSRECGRTCARDRKSVV